jgi:hypothetical protein
MAWVVRHQLRGVENLNLIEIIERNIIERYREREEENGG